MNYNVRLFWVLNISYWILHYTIQGLTNPIFLAFTESVRITLIFIFIVWIMLITGGYRFLHKKMNWGDKPLQFTGIQILLSAVLMTVLDIVCRFYFNPAIFVPFNFFSLEYSQNVYGRAFADTANKAMQIVLGQFSANAQWVKFMAYVIWTAAYNFYHISLNIRRNAIEKLNAENRAKDLELINLRSQLNPHFLFNALNSIHSLAMMKKDNASDAVLLLSDLMRYTLNYEKRDVVPLAEEIEVVEKYIELEKIRFGKKLNIEWHIDENALTAKIPPIIVQTLVENAIKHGLKESPKGVSIKIESRLEEGFFKIDIINSGQLHNTPSVNEQKNSGIGVENTRRRLEMIYGQSARFDLKNLNDAEVIASLSLPTQRKG
ncbi:MAG: histidine kinase [Saprospiraceae bacterium]|nr:histidine kinase [Saprospiraceae bacterium]